jgi:hypothetical protein
VGVLGTVDRLPGRFARFKLCAHFLKARCLSLNLLLLLRDSGFQCLHFAIQRGLLGVVGHALGPGAFGNSRSRYAAFGSSRDDERAQPSTGIDVHGLCRSGSTDAPRMFAI